MQVPCKHTPGSLLPGGGVGKVAEGPVAGEGDKGVQELGEGPLQPKIPDKEMIEMPRIKLPCPSIPSNWNMIHNATWNFD